MSPLAANLARRTLVRQPLAKFPLRRPQAIRQYGSKVQDAGLNTGPKRDPELYVRRPVPRSTTFWFFAS
jgi:hypothetical protein